MQRKVFLFFVIIILPMVLLVACAADSEEDSSVKSTGDPVMVDGIAVEIFNEHHYLIVNGHYPDPCTRISEVNQVVDGGSFKITLSTDKPADMVCAMMLAPFEVNLLLETGGLPPGEYSVELNGRETSFSLGE